MRYQKSLARWRRGHGPLTTGRALAIAVVLGTCWALAAPQSAWGEIVTWAGGDMTWTNPDSDSWGTATYNDGDDAQFGDTGAGTVTISGTVNPGSVTVNSLSNYTISGGAIGGSCGITKAGTGTLTLSGANTYTGTTTVSHGVLRMEHANALGATSAGTTVAPSSPNAAQLRLDNSITVNEPLTITGTGTSAAPGTRGALRSNSGTNVYSGLITVAGSAWINSTGSNLTINGGIGHTGTNGILRLDQGAPVVNTNPIDLGTGGRLQVNSTGFLSVGGNTFGTLEVDWGGNFHMGVANALPSGVTVIMGAASSYYPHAGRGTLDLYGHDQTIGKLADGGTNYTEEIVTNSQATPATLTINQSTNSTYNGKITGNLALTKQGTGTLTLSGVNTYTGDTDVQQGTLALSHDTSNNNIATSPLVRVAQGATLDVTGLNGSQLVLASGQTLKGNGTVNGNLGVAAGSTIAAGESPGHLTISGNYTQSGTMLAELAGTVQGTSYDWIEVLGQATLGGTVDVDLIDGFLPTAGDYFDILTAADGITNLDLSDVTFDFTGAAAPGISWQAQIVSWGTGSGEALRLTAVPEPGIVALFASGMISLGSVALVRRRKKDRGLAAN